MSEVKTFKVPVLVYGIDGPYIERFDVNIYRLIHHSGGNLTQYIQDFEYPPYEWAFADRDDEEEYG